MDMMDLVDVVVETVDARIPKSGRNPFFYSNLDKKKRRLVLTKGSLADPDMTRAWMKKLRSEGEDPIVVSALENLGGRLLRRGLGTGEGRRSKKTGPSAGYVEGLPIKIMVVGVPNSGKSTLINFLSGRRSARTGKKAGITRGHQWIRAEGGVLILDTPGVLPPYMASRELSQGAWRLAAAGALEESQYDQEEASVLLLQFLLENYPELPILEKRGRSCVENLEPEGAPPGAPDLKVAYEALSEIALARGSLRAQGLPDTRRVAALILKDFRDGRLGRITLE
jgi:ribosome biogenesis GTPase A